ncbi:MAG TPA: glycosyltransferase family 39 protein [Sphingomicrobium sp.]|nr:glycosyltransferase family 39 protein [Sphingomicrobium sp.]
MLNWVRGDERLGVGRRRRADIICAALLVACALFMFVDRRTFPIIIWDESRLAVNALEMNQRGWSLVTTYGFAPDLWNSKPPLMIWLMNLSISIFGASEFALRLPAMLAAIGTLIVVFAFVRRVTHSASTAALAMVLLSTSAAFYGEHGARTADYDSLLCFFTTAYLATFYFAVHRRVPGRGQLFAAGALVALATLTKTIAGIVPGAGVALYLLVSGRFRRVVTTPRYVVMMIVALMPLAAFYLAREWLAPGYLKAVWFNDFAGRYEDQLGLDAKPWWFFLRALFYSGIFSGGLLALFAPLGLVGLKGQARQALLYAICCVAAQLLLISIPATRLVQYALPALPWLAIACAIAIGEQLPRLFEREELNGSPRARIIVSAALAVVAVISIAVPAARIRYGLLQKRAFYPRASYGALFASLHDRGVQRVTVIEPGIKIGSLDAYAPQLRYYLLLWDTRGMAIDRVEQPLWPRMGDIVASCDPRWSRELISMGGAAVGTDGCASLAAGAHQRLLDVSSSHFMVRI